MGKDDSNENVHPSAPNLHYFDCAMMNAETYVVDTFQILCIEYAVALIRFYDTKCISCTAKPSLSFPTL